MNWQIPDESIIDRDIVVNSNNEDISIESINSARSLKTG